MPSEKDPSDDPDHFPVDWHPHRGMDILSYFRTGLGRHGDSLGNRESFETPGMQWMSVGSGVEHAEGGAFYYDTHSSMCTLYWDRYITYLSIQHSPLKSSFPPPKLSPYLSIQQVVLKKEKLHKVSKFGSMCLQFIK